MLIFVAVLCAVVMIGLSLMYRPEDPRPVASGTVAEMRIVPKMKGPPRHLLVLSGRTEPVFVRAAVYEATRIGSKFAYDKYSIPCTIDGKPYYFVSPATVVAFALIPFSLVCALTVRMVRRNTSNPEDETPSLMIYIGCGLSTVISVVVAAIG